MDIGQDIEISEDAVNQPQTRPSRPARPTRPVVQKRVLRPLVLDTPVSEDGEPLQELPKPSARPVRPERRKLDLMEDTSRPARRSRVLEPDQIEASRSMPEPPPSSVTRDALHREEDEMPSKLGGVMQAFGQIAARLKRSSSEDAKAAKEDVSETDSDVSDAKSGGSIVASVLGRFKSSKATSENIVEEIARPVESVMEAPAPYVEEQVVPTSQRKGFLARFDTPAMGVTAAILLTFVSFIGASVVLG